MPRMKKGDKFFLQNNSRKKGVKLMGVNVAYSAEITLKDLLAFMAEHELDPARVLVPPAFITHIKKQ